jgi:RNA polymerase sigma-70 factor (ECF subfamily)
MSITYKTISLSPPVVRKSDLSLLEAAKQMDRDALVEIFDTYSPALYNYAYRLCNDALMADYIVGDVFAKLLEHLAAGKGPSTNLRSYLYEITYHLVVDEARYSQRSTSFEAAEYTPVDHPSTHTSAENRVIFEHIMRAIRNNLTEDQRHVVILRFLEGLSLQETARIIGKELNNVKVIQSRAIAVLRKALDSLDYKDV